MIQILTLSVLLSYACPQTKLIGFDKPITAQENESLQYASKRCRVIYSDSPCLKSFEKREEQVFWAICGKEEK